MRRVAKALIAANVVKGQRVALLGGNRPEWIFAAWAIGMVGAVVIPMSTFAGEEERDYVLRHSDASLLIVQDALLKHRFARGDRRDVPGDGHRNAVRRAAFPAPGDRDSGARRGAAAVRDVGGLPRGGGPRLRRAARRGRGAGLPVRRRHRHLHVGHDCASEGGHAQPADARPAVLADRRPHPADPEDRVASTFPFFWSAGFGMGMGAVFSQGACLLVQEWFDAGSFLELMEREKASTVFVAPHQDAALAEHEDAATRTSARSARSARRRSCARSPATCAPTGAPSAPTACPRRSRSPRRCRATRRAEQRALHGQPYPGVEVRIVDDEGVELPPGMYGEICVRGLTVMDGYYKVPREDVFDADGFFHTRDAGALLEDGYPSLDGPALRADQDRRRERLARRARGRADGRGAACGP